MPTVRSLDHLVLRVGDLDRSLAFYRGLLGLAVEGLEEHRRGARPFVSLRVGEALLDLVPDPAHDPATAASGGLLHFCVTLADLGEAIRELRAAGVAFLHDAPVPRAGARGVAPSIYVRDPDGYVVELKQATDA
ncbi:MAG: VOC family protein [Deltaproteobacteria bacterium]|nr:VOC family protein [Deltaproteobacteria bacterium]